MMNDIADPQMPSAASTAIIVPYFGEAPPWLPFFLKSCERNPGFDWILFSDFDLGSAPENVRHHRQSFDEFVTALEEGLELNLDVVRKDSYKLTDLKPMLGHVFADILKPFDYWGWGDLDVIYGDLRKHFGSQLGQFDVISCHTYLLSGHLAFLRNTQTMRSLFSCFGNWRKIVTLPTHQSFDESIMSMLFFRDHPDRQAFFNAPLFLPTALVNGIDISAHFSERFSTFNRPRLLPNGRIGLVEEWYWDHGRLTSDAMGDRSLAYAHFSNWNTGRYAKGKVRRIPWTKGGMTIDERLKPPFDAFRINANGFFSMKYAVTNAKNSTP